MTVLPLAFAFLGLAHPAPALPPSSNCPSHKIDGFFLQWRLGPSDAKEGPPPGGTAKTFLGHKDGWLRECPGNETIWYAVVRAAELTSPDRKASADLIAAARTAVPNSVWIETVRARALGTVEAAEAAVRFDPSHIPAQVALAAAYDRAGDRESALRILRPLRDLHRIAGGPLLLARVAWALGDWQLAADSAKRETDHEGSFIEPVSSIVFVGEARLLEGEARLKLGQADKALTAFHEAEVWSSLDAMERLRSPTPALERAMEARLKKSHLDEEFRCRILEYLGALRLRSGDVKAGVHLLTKALFLPEYSCGFDALQSGGPEVRKVLEKLRASPRLTARERERIDEVLKPQLPRPLAEPGN